MFPNVLHRTRSRERSRSKGRFALLLLAAVLAIPAFAVTAPPAPAEAAAPGPKDATAVMFAYTWNAIARECTDTLGPAGYGYVQTSPPQEHVLGSAWWTHYQPVSYKLDSRLGTEAEFQAMIDTCEQAGVGVIVDAVINHMSGQSAGGTGWAGTQFQHYNYPGTYSSWDFHSCRRDIANYQNRWEVQECNLVNLSDLNTGSAYVQNTIAGYLNKLVGMGVAGFRIDAVKHIAAADMQAIWSKVNNRDSLYVVQEVIRANEPIQPEEYTSVGDIHEFAFARKLKEAFGGGTLNWLIEGNGIGSSWSGFLPQANAAVFVDNHDTERNHETLSYADGATYDLAQIFTLAWNYGSPSIHSGYSFSDNNAGPITDAGGNVIDPVKGQGNWTFKHAQNDIMNMVGFRNTTYGKPVTDKWTNGGSAIAFGRGDAGYVAINRGASLTRTFTTTLPDGTYYNVIDAVRTGTTWSGPTVTVSGGQFSATVGANDAIALHAGAKATTGGGGTPVGDDLTVYYSTTKNWSAYNVHYKVGAGAWTTAPGQAMAAACAGWVSKTIDSNGASVTAAFNNGAGTWDNNGGSDYSLTGATASVKNGVVTTANPCAAPPTDDLTVYYSTSKGWSAYNVHYRIGAGAWTAVPGQAMAAACTGWVSKTVDSNGASVTAAFNNGAGTWDNNGGQDYAFAGTIAAVSNGAVTTVNPCG
ncbi:carbohydrate binding domain-containing protein [Microbacterium sp. SD291]|uniref:carbohydrate binding domain-containing protein n=1 Tax=Microbacterium sp. SD291 TaxID=2782007 RepID=UPI001A96D79B|nr:carbohydrate binding domain-containing protein [Microbacterium sp. SD291]MBO0981208.1 alpha-amylase [Microbacterium sp. SD291]